MDRSGTGDGIAIIVMLCLFLLGELLWINRYSIRDWIRGRREAGEAHRRDLEMYRDHMQQVQDGE